MIPYILFLPYFYGFNTRARTNIHKLSFIFVVLVPILLNVYLMTSGLFEILDFILAFTVMYAVYEIGYIYNDAYTAKKEKKPTQWLKDEYIAFVDDTYPLLIAARVMVILIGLFFLSYRQLYNFKGYVIMMGMLYMAFAFHNYYRGKINIITDGCLQIAKYCSILILFLNLQEVYVYLLYIYLEIGLVRTVEFGIGKKYIFPFLQIIKVDNLRVVYYFVLTVIAGVLSVTYKSSFHLFIGSLYMFCFRLVCLLLGKNKKISDNRMSNDKGYHI